MANTRVQIGVLGASGYVGSRLSRLATASGVDAVRFSRSERPGFRRIPADGVPDFSGLDVVINLVGEPILGLWTRAKRQRIFESRVAGTKRVVEAIALARPSPSVLVNASAIGYYGDTGESEVDESAPAGSGFLAETCQAWEEAARGAESLGIRVAILRIGFVVGPGGAMRLVAPVFRFGLGGTLGNGRQWMSCIHVDDVAGMALWAAENETAHGPINAVMPRPVRNSEFTRALAKSLNRPAIFPAPAILLRMVLGELSRIMLDSVRVVPGVAKTLGYAFRFADLDTAFSPPPPAAS